MSNSTRYFQLTPEILVEYNYNYLSSIDSQTGDADHIIDLEGAASVIGNTYNATRTFLWKPYEDTFVLPINKSESKFIQCKNNRGKFIWEWNNDFTCDNSFSSGSDIENKDEFDILGDTFRLHFTSRNYFGDYDGLIICVYIYDKIKNKIGLMSYCIKRNDDPTINPNPVLINQKLYTTYKDFSIPNVSAIVSADSLVSKLQGESKLVKRLSPRYEIMVNTPVVMNIYGIKSSYVDNTYEYYSTEKINSIYIPLEDNSNRFSVNIDEASDGDYFKIYPVVNNKNISFSDYIYNISDGNPENYIVFHELTLTEHYLDASNNTQDETTHREQYIINSSIYSDKEGETYKMNKDELDGIMYYRPIVLNSSRIVSFTIEVKTSIINTIDNTTIVKKATFDYPGIDKNTGKTISGQNPKKYGKKMNKIYLGDIPAQVNVYNKKPDVDTDGIKLTNASSNVKIENHQHSIIGFIECTNVGVSIDQVPTEMLQ